MKASGHIALAAHPLHIVRGGPGQRRIKKRLPKRLTSTTRLSLRATASARSMRAQLPGRLFIKAANWSSCSCSAMRARSSAMGIGDLTVL